MFLICDVVCINEFHEVPPRYLAATVCCYRDAQFQARLRPAFSGGSNAINTWQLPHRGHFIRPSRRVIG